MEIKVDDLSGQAIADFLEEHINDMKAISPPESKHALDIKGLKQADITFWTMREKVALAGCGALKELSLNHGEIKSMRISKNVRGKGLASKMLQHIISEAETRGYQRLSLETGSMDYFKPAIALYKKHGFAVCAPFANYKEDPNSIFMSKLLSNN